MYNTFFVPIELKSCPFCGELPYTRIHEVHDFNSAPVLRAKIACEKCDIEKHKDINLLSKKSTFSNILNLMSEVTQSWNERAKVES